MMLAWKIAPALACGNTVVLKPAETTPLTALLFAEICQQADLPPGVVNILTGAGATGRVLVEHSGHREGRVHRLNGGRQGDRGSLADTKKKVTLELGGKAANIVFDDAPIDQAVEGIVNGIFFNQGHVCCAGSRLLVQESVAEEVRRSPQAAPHDPAVGVSLPTRTPTSVRSTRPSSWPGSASSRRWEGTRARCVGARHASCPSAVLVLPQRFSPTSRRRTGSPGRRSSVPCSRS